MPSLQYIFEGELHLFAAVWQDADTVVLSDKPCSSSSFHSGLLEGLDTSRYLATISNILAPKYRRVSTSSNVLKYRVFSFQIRYIV